MDNDSSKTAIADQMQHIRARIAKAARAAGRSADEVTLIGISKRQPPERINAALAAGLTDFGENRVQEAVAHWRDHGRARPATLHGVGHLQTNKAEEAVALFDVIHVLDREKLARALCHAEEKLGLRRRYFLQVNTGMEEQKSGLSPTAVPEFLDWVRGDVGLEVVGLMCLPPVEEEPALHFALLADMAARLDLAQLSMGMSNDFETAIRHGATHIRVGSALFGERPG